MRVPAGYTARACTLDDLEAVADLVRAADLADVGFADPIREHIAEGWRVASTDIARDTIAVFGGDELAAQALVEGMNPERSLDIYGRVHPDHRARGVGSALLAWCEGRALERSPALPILRGSAPSTDGRGRALFERRGFAYVRTFLHMHRSLGAEVEAGHEPRGIAIRSYDRARDLRGTYDALEEAFADHWGYEPFPFEEHVREMERTDHRLAAVAAAGEEVVGTAIARLVEGQGWIDVVGTRAAWRGRGIAKAMLLRVFAALRGAGASSVMLNVDSENGTGATALYDAVGMRVHRGWDVFEKRFDAAARH
ncbi:MAG TPA: GNAT family N-acetyltransferase [Actinomycetota bacterium]|nr:GNAT family N-acetyltransferase [Actinomycetota bacterium]